MFTSAALRAATFSRRVASTQNVPSLARHRHTVVASSLASNSDSQHSNNGTILVASIMALTAAATSKALCEEHLTPADVAKEDFEQVQASHDINKMPIYTSEQVAENNGDDGKPIWMSYGGVVYDVTNFIPNHPGGTEKILTAAGSVSPPSHNAAMTSLFAYFP